MNKDKYWVVWETDYYEVCIAKDRYGQYIGSSHYYKTEDDAISFFLAVFDAGYKATIKRHGHGEVTRLED